MEAEKIIQSLDGRKFKVIEEPVKKPESGQWYCWVGPKEPPEGWLLGGMDFMLDGKAHQCNTAVGSGTSFYDSYYPDGMWDWGDLKHFRRCVPVS